jgi:rhodanese-related sulfurtransferase
MLAAKLQRTLLLQKTEYSVVFFDARDKQDYRVDHLAMEPVNDVDYFTEECNDSDAQRRFNFCVFPCLRKVQDDSETIVFRARVCCSVR